MTLSAIKEQWAADGHYHPPAAGYNGGHDGGYGDGYDGGYDNSGMVGMSGAAPATGMSPGGRLA